MEIGKNYIKLDETVKQIFFYKGSGYVKIKKVTLDKLQRLHITIE